MDGASSTFNPPIQPYYEAVDDAPGDDTDVDDED